jgi:hypothetical protein
MLPPKSLEKYKLPLWHYGSWIFLFSLFCVDLVVLGIVPASFITTALTLVVGVILLRVLIAFLLLMISTAGTLSLALVLLPFKSIGRGIVRMVSGKKNNADDQSKSKAVKKIE